MLIKVYGDYDLNRTENNLHCLLQIFHDFAFPKKYLCLVII